MDSSGGAQPVNTTTADTPLSKSRTWRFSFHLCMSLVMAVLFMGLTITLLGLKGGMSREVQSPDFFDALYLSYMVPFSLPTIPALPLYLALNAMGLAILLYEWRRHGRIGVYSAIGAGWLVLQQTLHVPVVHATWFFDFCQQVAGLVRYR
jgi:hypothetical protein